jgi:S1-C subfamily serine protease
MTSEGFHEDFLDLLRAMAASGARYLIVGAHAMAVHGVPRTTGDLGIWIDPAAANAARVWAALVEFGAPLADHGLTVADLQTPGTVYQIGLPPGASTS